MNSQSYIYGSAAPKRTRFEAPDNKPKQRQQPRVGVVPGGNVARAITEAQAIAIAAAKIAVIAIITFAIVGFGRISLAAATVAESIEATNVKHNLEQVRSSINDKEVEQSALSNPTRIKSEAEALGMASPATIGVIDVSGDIVTMASDGSLSLTESLAAKTSIESAALASASSPSDASSQAVSA